MTSAHLLVLLAKRVASDRETYYRMPTDPPHAAIAMGRLGCRVREQDSCTRCQTYGHFASFVFPGVQHTTPQYHDSCCREQAAPKVRVCTADGGEMRVARRAARLRRVEQRASLCMGPLQPGLQLPPQRVLVRRL